MFLVCYYVSFISLFNIWIEYCILILFSNKDGSYSINSTFLIVCLVIALKGLLFYCSTTMISSSINLFEEINFSGISYQILKLKQFLLAFCSLLSSRLFFCVHHIIMFICFSFYIGSRYSVSIKFLKSYLMCTIPLDCALAQLCLMKLFCNLLFRYSHCEHSNRSYSVVNCCSIYF